MRGYRIALAVGCGILAALYLGTVIYTIWEARR